MPRKYIRKRPDRNVCTPEQLKAAKKLLEEGISKRMAAKMVGINESTLRKRLKLHSTASSMGRCKPTFTREQEEPVGSAEDDAATTQEQSHDVEYIKIEGTLESNSDPLQEKPEEPTNDSYYLSELNPPTSPPSSSGRQSTRIQKRVINRRKRPYESVFANVIQRLESTVSNVVNNTPNRQEITLQSEDEFHMFALSVAAQLRQLPLHVAITTQSKIQSMLSEARLASLFSNSSTQLSIGIVKTEEASDD